MYCRCGKKENIVHADLGAIRQALVIGWENEGLSWYMRYRHLDKSVSAEKKRKCIEMEHQPSDDT